MSQLNWIELFGGGGGVGTGLEQAGHTVSAMIELDPEIAQCYRDNHPHTKVITSDIRAVDLHTLPGDINALWASPVCKGDSQARDKNLPARADISIGVEVNRFIKAINPHMVVIENVRHYQNNPTFTEILKTLVKMQYHIDYRMIDMSDYGIPQQRERLILQARRGDIAWMKKGKRVGWYTALEDMLPRLEACELAQWQKDLWKPEYSKAPSLIYGFYDYRRSSDVRELSLRYAHEPSKTIVSSHNALCARAYFPETGTALKLGVQGNARLQTFPDSYQWPVVKSRAIEIIGNAVPPLFVKKLVEQYNETEKNEGLFSIVESEYVA